MNKLTTLAASIAMTLISQQSFAFGSIKMDEMLSKADLVFQGKITNIQYKDSNEGLPHTFVTYRINQIITGQTREKEITLRFIGGEQRKGDVVRYLSVSDVPDFEQGESDILFVNKNNTAICPLVDCSKGRFRDLNGLVASENGQALVQTANNSIEFSQQNMLEKIASTNRASGFSKGFSEFEGEEMTQSNKSEAILDTASFVENLKERAYVLQSKGQLSSQSKKLDFVSSNAKEAFSTPLFKAVTPQDSVKVKSPEKVKTNRNESDFDRWEEEMVKKNGGDPVIKVSKNQTSLQH